MWYYEGWLPEETVEFSRTHYAAYTVKRPDGLRIISIDTDICESVSPTPSVHALLNHLPITLQGTGKNDDHRVFTRA